MLQILFHHLNIMFTLHYKISNYWWPVVLKKGIAIFLHSRQEFLEHMAVSF
jgi:hypothetical protein